MKKPDQKTRGSLQIKRTKQDRFDLHIGFMAFS